MPKRTNNKNIIFKIFALLQVVFLVLPLVVSPVKADTISNPDAFVDPITQALHDSAISTTKQALKTIMKDFGLGDDAFEEFGESLNVSNNKVSAPEVQLLFNPSSPKVAEKITATALPKHFQSTKENLYFTWYLKHEKCKKASRSSSDYEESCDLNNDNRVDIEDWKIEAMREIATNGFDKNKANYSTTEDDEDGFGSLEEYAQSGIITDEDCDGLSVSLGSPLPTNECDGGTGTQENISKMCANADDNPVRVCTKAPFGGASDKQPTGGFRCYVKDYEDGKIYEIVESSGAAAGGKSGCTVKVNGAELTELDPYDDGRAIYRSSQKGGDYSDPVTVEISDCDNGADDYTETFNNPGNADDCDSDPDDSGRHWLGDGTLWKGNSESDCNLVILLANKYTEDTEDDEGDGDSDRYHHWNSNAWDGAGVAMVLCDDSPEMESCTVSSLLGTQTLVQHLNRDVEGLGCREHWKMNSVDSSIFDGPQTVTCVAKSGGTYTYYINDADEGGVPPNTGIVYDDATCKCEEGESSATQNTSSSCEHLFPHATDEDGDIEFVTGDGIFDVEEEEFWGTNPDDPDTAGDGIGDEAALAGVSRDKFTWVYNTGDQVGVAVEGNSTNPTKHDDSSYMIMWALPKKNFDVDSDCKIRNKGKYTKQINDRSVEIETAEIDINGCLEENLVDPMESPAGGAPAKNLEVDLSYSPAKPFNDSENSRGSNVVVQSTLTNSGTNDSRDVYYRWTVFGKNGNDTDFMGDWGNSIDGELDIGVTEGLNKDSINFNLNLDKNSSAYNAIFGGGSQGYIKVVLEAEENYGSGMTKSGKGEKIIKVTTGDNSQINVFEAQYLEGKLSLDTSLDSESRLCSSEDDSVNSQYCPVIKNLIVGAQLDIEATSGLRNFSWTLNGDPIECTGEISGLCSDTSQKKTIFFAVTGEEGENYTLTAVANDVDPSASAENLGERVEISKMFQVVEPTIKLGPMGGVDDETCESEEGGFNAKDMGDFKDIRNDGALIKECSTSTFNAQPGTFNIQAIFFPSFMGRHIKESYEKTDLTEDEKDEILTLSANGEKIENISFDDDNNINATYDATDAESGETVRISASGTYSQSREVKRILNNVFKISQFNFSNSELSDTIRIKIEESDIVGIKGKANIMASLMSNLPIQMLFLFRMMLTVGTVIFISGTVFALGKQEA